ncbi:MAG: hypothetical protein EOO89_29080 [Pedobacter sp.]|nr:MAG: hypothetical protein EOO89_29080 [Pedobacter sp.]
MADISINLRNINELLHSPGSPYGKRRLKPDAEEFIVEEAEAFPRKVVIHINVGLAISEIEYKDEIAPAIHGHFRYRREQSQKEYKRTLRYGWRILFIALGLLAVIFSLTELTLHLVPDSKVVLFIRESFIIFGWVALWRPMELLLYDWYPIKTDINLYARLEHSNVHVTVNES